MAATTVVWRPALGLDVDSLVRLTQHHFEQEADTIFRTDPLVLAHNLTRAVVDQFYNPGTALVRLAVDDQNQVQAWIWAERGQRAVWSQDEMVAIKIIHVDMRLSLRTRVNLTQQCLEQAEHWALVTGVPIVCSTTMRWDQEGFLRLHERRGYERRGSICYRRLLGSV